MFTVKLDTLQWKFLKVDESKVKLINKSGHSVNIAMDITSVFMLAKFYLDRGSTRVTRMFLENIPSWNLFVFKIGHLRIKLSEITEVPFGLIEHAQIGVLTLDTVTYKHEWNDPISELNCTQLKIRTNSVTSDDVFASLKAPQLEIEETFTSQQKFTNMCKKLKRLEHGKRSCYEGGLGGILIDEDNWDPYWSRLKDTLHVGDSHSNFFLSKTDNPEYELLVERMDEMISPYFRYRVEVVESASINSVNQNQMNNVSIQGDQRYIDYQFDFFTIPVLIAVIPLVYLVPTTFLLVKIFSVYSRMLVTKKEEGSLNPNVFFVIILSQFSSFCYMLSDYFTIRLPSTGIMTSWCASQQPNHFLKLLFFFSVYFNYTAMLFPFLLSVLRLIPIYFPGRQNELSARIVYFSTPLVFLYPFLFSFFLIPALGFCRQLLGPWHFGAIYIFFSGSWRDMKLANFLFFNVIFWLLACILTNITLYRKLKKLRSKRKSVRLQRAELSLTMTSFSMLISYVTNLIFIIMFIIHPPLSTYVVALRPFGNDCDIVFVPWVFYLTHPAFKKKQRTRVEMSKPGTMHTTI